MQRTLASETINKVGETVLLKGWVNTRRDHGKIVFIDLRDRSGILQTVLTPETANEIRPEDIVEITGIIKTRPEKLANPNLETGKVELAVAEVKIISKAETLPFPIDSPGYEIDEEIRLKYRYLDIRRPRMTNNLRTRYKIISFLRNYLTQ